MHNYFYYFVVSGTKTKQAKSNQTGEE